MEDMVGGQMLVEGAGLMGKLQIWGEYFWASKPFAEDYPRQGSFNHQLRETANHRPKTSRQTLSYVHCPARCLSLERDY